MTESVFDLPPPERLTRLRELAREARESANHDDMVEYRGSFLKIADQWERMASELETGQSGLCSVASNEALASIGAKYNRLLTECLPVATKRPASTRL